MTTFFEDLSEQIPDYRGGQIADCLEARRPGPLCAVLPTFVIPATPMTAKRAADLKAFKQRIRRYQEGS